MKTFPIFDTLEGIMENKEGVAAIKALDKELKRLHRFLGSGDAKANGLIFGQIQKLEDTLDSIAKRHNGLEY